MGTPGTRGGSLYFEDFPDKSRDANTVTSRPNSERYKVWRSIDLKAATRRLKSISFDVKRLNCDIAGLDLSELTA